jgi:hypothetical protein
MYLIGKFDLLNLRDDQLSFIRNFTVIFNELKKQKTDKLVKVPRWGKM